MSNDLRQPSIANEVRALRRELQQLKRMPGRRTLHAQWSATMPGGTGWAGAVWRVPYHDGVSVTFTLKRLLLRLDTPGTTTTTVELEKSAGGGAFSATTAAAVSCASGVYENDTSGDFGTVESGDLLRINFSAIGTDADDYTVQVEGMSFGN